MSGRRAVLLLFLFLAVLAALTWTAMVGLQTPFAGTRSERAAVEAALARLGASERSWRTLVAAASVTRPVPIASAWAAFSRLDGWASARAVSTAPGGVAPGTLVPGATVEEARSLGFPLGTGSRRYRVEAVTPLAEAVLCTDDAGDRVCRLFRFQEAGEGRTTVVLAEVRHGVATGLSSPLVRSRLTRRLRSAAVALLSAAGRNVPAGP
jgi:hypothetical protein